MQYDIIVVGSGPGGYVAAIRAAQLGFKTAIVEKEHLGGICLNWGCIPTKALLKSAQVLEYVNRGAEYGIEVSGKPDFQAIIKRSRNIATRMSKGVEFLLKKNRIDVISGFGKLLSNHNVEVTDNAKQSNIYEARHIILATGSHPKNLPNISIDSKKIITYKEALSLEYAPKSMLIIGSGAIGMELAYFYHTIGTHIHIIESLPQLLPLEDEEVGKAITLLYRKRGINVHTSCSVEKCLQKGSVIATEIKSEQGTQYIETDTVLCAVGIEANIQNIGLEALDIKIENKKIIVDKFYATTLSNVYAIGDIIPTPALAHVASHEGIVCIEHIAFKEHKTDHPPIPIDYSNIPSCIYTSPEIASLGLTEAQAKANNISVKVGKFPLSASGKATATGSNEGFVKIIYGEKYGELLGLHMVGANVTEAIAEGVIAKKLETTYQEILSTVHAHPTIHEAIMEATAQAWGNCINL